MRRDWSDESPAPEARLVGRRVDLPHHETSGMAAGLDRPSRGVAPETSPREFLPTTWSQELRRSQGSREPTAPRPESSTPRRSRSGESAPRAPASSRVPLGDLLRELELNLAI